MRAVVVQFPGSNCDHDCHHVLQHVLGVETQFVWHKETELPKADLVVLPGGFSYGDYLRSGAIARFSPIMNAVARFAGSGGLVFGICNGFQILTESGLLPGALMRNRGLKFVCQDVTLRVDATLGALNSKLVPDEELVVPVAHGDGRYYIDDEGRRALEGEGQVLFRYVEENGQVADVASINGSVGAIAGVMNATRNVFGMMPHPERCSEALIGGPSHGNQNTDGIRLFQGLIDTVGGRE
jgi:phosphoribosylformylglycinamidine synthase subunit PurQ / glutaminase